MIQVRILSVWRRNKLDQKRKSVGRKSNDAAVDRPARGSSELPATASEVADESSQATQGDAGEFVVVGVGTSAGGLEAFKRLLRLIPMTRTSH